MHSSVTRALTKYVGMGKEGKERGKAGDMLFPTREGTPQLPRNLLRILTRHGGKGFHSFRRFRETVLSEMSCNHDIKIYWMGHKPESMSELYSKLSKKLDMRLAEAERVGIGFNSDQPFTKVVKS